MIYKILEYRTFSSNLINWFFKFKRELPWRVGKDPFKIWLAEIIMQQTRISQGLPYYEKFTDSFQTVCDLANADEDTILRLWQGLGYYSRAKNMHRCAKIICREREGEFPQTYSELIKLPGIGPYTSAAISSMAFDQPHAVVDGNVQRVISRYLGIKENIALNSTRRVIEELANKMIDSGSPGLYNHAIMDLGAMICTPSKPKCQECPVSATCYSFKNSLQNDLPVNKKIVKRQSRYFYYWVVKYENEIILQKRDNSNIWKGLYEFYLVEESDKIEPVEATDDFVNEIISKNSLVKGIFEYKKHVLSHRDIYSYFIVLDIDKQLYEFLKLNFSYQFYSLDEILQLPKPILIDKFLRDEII